MAFFKIGDAQPINSIINDGQEQVCHKCDKPLITIAFDEDDNAHAVCDCEILEPESDDE